ncbi:unnamed protein product [Rotaria socialis]|uniref:Uncharacterized protein n=1 Tax=Rotaria socialis TaxID=392032 RepID=A0A817LFH4_9BILA|nr:unnamed protein product [Rotaria socialis]
MHKSKVVNTKREHGSSNNKSQNNRNTSKQPLKTDSFLTLGALVTGFTSSPTTMADEINQADALIIKPATIDINGKSDLDTSLSKSLCIKTPCENKNEHEILDEQNSISSSSNIDHGVDSGLSSDPCENKNEHEILDEQNSISSSSNIDHGVDSGLSSEVTYTEAEKINGDDESSSTSVVSSTNLQRETSPTSGVIIPEEKRVTDRVKVFEAVANNNDNQITKNGSTKKKSITSASFSTADHKQISSSSSIETSDSQSITEMKPAKSKSKKSSLKKQIQNLLKIDKSPIHDELSPLEEQLNGKKNKKDNNSISTSTFKHQSSPKSAIEPLEIQIPPAKVNEENSSSTNVSKLINTFQTNEMEQIIAAVTKSNTSPLQSGNNSFFIDSSFDLVLCIYMYE